MNAASFTRHIAAGRAAAEELTPQLERAYRAVLRAAGRDAADRFAQLAADHLTADATSPGWTPPEDSELIDDAKLAADAKKRTASAHKRALKAVVAPALRDVNVSYDITNPFISAQFEKLGVRAQDLGAAVRLQIANAIRDSYQQGLSIPDTAAAIRTAVDAVSDSRATLLARTDMIGLVNGGSLAAAQIVDAGLFKQWLTAGDEKVRDTHADADGQTVPLDQPFSVGGSDLAYPGDPDGPDEEVYNCRCTIVYADTADAALAAAATGPDVKKLAMVAVHPAAAEADAIAVDGGLPAEELHVTLLFLGAAEDVDEESLALTVAAVANELPPLAGVVGGAGHFAEGPEGFPAILLPDVQGLATLQETLRARLAAAGIESPSEHGWTPHMTLTYAAEPQVPDGEKLGEPLHFDAVSVVVGGNRTDYPLTGTLASGGHMDTSPAVTAAVTITVADPSADGEVIADGTRWQAVLCVEGAPTEDGRLLSPGSMTWRELPLTLMALLETGPGGHEGALVAGRIDRIWRDAVDDRVIMGEGVFDSSDFGREVARLVSERTVRGVSIDPIVTEFEYRDGETGQVLDGDNLIQAIIDDRPIVFVYLEAVIMAATVCNAGAIADANIIVASGGPLHALWRTEWETVEVDGLVASARAPVAPVEPPRAWFETQEPPGLMPLTVTDDGRVYGHIADWTTCHTGIAGVCTTAPPSPSAYAYFHVGEIGTLEGDRLAVGKLMLGGKHAPLSASRLSAAQHYDDNTTVGAYVRAVDGEHGIWVAGAVRHDLDPDRLQELRANPPSGDWRSVNHRLELIAALAVPVPGFPVPRAEAGLVAAAGEIEVSSLIASAGLIEPTQGVLAALVEAGLADESVLEQELSAEDAALRVRVLAARAEGGVEGLAALAEAS